VGKTQSSGFRTGEYELPEELTSYVVCEMRYDSGIVPTPARALAADGAHEPQRDALNELLSHFPVKQIKPHFAVRKTDLQERMFAIPAVAAAVAPAPSLEFVLAGFVRIEVENRKQAARLADRLNQDPNVWKAFVAPRPEPAANAAPPSGTDLGSRNFEPSQGYLDSAPDGFAAIEVWPQGATGKGINVCDVEGAWLLDHEDLPPNISLIGGTMLPSLANRNHGTAVLGVMISMPKNVGCAGISYQARAMVQSAVIDSVFNAAGAIFNAASKLRAGDILQIELHAAPPGGPADKFLAMQYWPDVFAAIQVAVSKGIVVVEVAGNGNANFDSPDYADTGLQKDSGAIVVGAGVPPTNYFDAYAAPGFAPYTRIGTPRSRIWFSNYGEIVNVQGWGWHVTTLGYGDAQGGKSEKTWYTLRFAGTSSASPMVAGAAACLQSYAKVKHGTVLTPNRLRDILIQTGTPQADDAPRAPLSQKIGPQPDLARGLQAIDEAG
jgi:hypothetical protein